MAKDVSIVIDDHNTGPCTARYNIRIKLASASNWTALQPQYDSPIVISNLADDVEYDYEISRSCCDGNISTAATGSFTTTV